MRRAQVDDGAGNTEGVLQPFFGPVWARIRPINGREEVLAQKLSGVQPVEVTIRYCVAAASILPTDVLVDRQNRPYNITAIQNPDERNEYLSILAVRGKAVG